LLFHLFPPFALEWQSVTGGVNHGFVRTQRGDITTFDVPGAGTGSGQGNIPGSSDPAGGITGYYVDASGVPRLLASLQSVINPREATTGRPSSLTLLIK
jgi:hypothetical protein